LPAALPSAPTTTFTTTSRDGTSRRGSGKVRVSTQAAATAKRRRLSEERFAVVLDKREPIDGLLRRRTVKPVTRDLYTRVANNFLQASGLAAHSPPDDIDRALDRALVALFLAGEAPAETNILFYAVRWMCCRTNSELRLSFRSRQGHSRVSRTKHIEPETWEATVLMCLALLQDSKGSGPRKEAARACAGFLLSFDIYGRGTDIVKAMTNELRAPLGTAAGSCSTTWTLTLFPCTGDDEAKNRRQDVTKTVGATDPRRAWLGSVCKALKAIRPQTQLLLNLSETRYVFLFHKARKLAGLPPSHPHRLRHGGASADGLLTSVSDATIQQRGAWSSPKSVMLYRQPARYLRELNRLSQSQRDLAATSCPEVLRLIVRFLRA